MTEREAAVNRDLRALDDAHRLGQIGRAEYRARRRNVLAGLASAEAATERNPVQPPGAGEAAAQTVKKAAAAGKASVTPARLPPTPPPAAAGSGRPGLPVPAILLAVLGLLVLVIAVWLLFLRPASGRPAAAAAPATEAMPADPAAIFEKAARQVVADDRWDVASADSLAGNWNALDATARAGLRGKPIYEQLRQQLQRRRKVVDLLLEGAAADDPKRGEAAALKALDTALAGV